MSSLRDLLAHYRDNAQTEREKGNYFERLAVVFIKSDPGKAQQFEDCWLFAEWATMQGLDRRVSPKQHCKTREKCIRLTGR